MACEVLFWPGMRKAISDMCDTCSVCAQYSRTLTKEPMKSLPIPTQPWQIVSQDIFTHEQKDYLVTICHFSDWIEVDELQDTLSATVINKTKAHFARFGIPQICHTDNGSQFTSKEYENFATHYGFKHTTSSPYHPYKLMQLAPTTVATLKLFIFYILQPFKFILKKSKISCHQLKTVRLC